MALPAKMELAKDNRRLMLELVVEGRLPSGEHRCLTQRLPSQTRPLLQILCMISSREELNYNNFLRGRNKSHGT